MNIFIIKSNIFVIILIAILSICKLYESKVCETEICKRLGEELNKIMNKSADPCDDFSSYVCGNMDKVYSILPGEESFSAFTQIQSSVRSTLKELLENQSTANQSLPQAKAAIYYRSCMNEESRNKLSQSTILEVAKEISEGNDFEFILIKLLKSGLGSRFFSISVDQDTSYPEYNILKIVKPSFILSESTLRDSDSASKEMIAHYIKSMKIILNKLGIFNHYENVIDEIFKLHIKLAKSLPSIADQNDPEKYTNKLSIRDLQMNYPSICWMRVINEVLKNSDKELGDEDIINVFSLEYLDSMSEILKEYLDDPQKKQIIKMDLEWSVLSGLVETSLDYLIEANDEHKSVAYGKKSNQEKWKECVEITSTTLQEIVGNMFVKSQFKPSQKKDIEMMIDNIKGALKDVIENLTWMDSNTKSSALEKVKAIRHKIGYPESLLSETYLTKKFGPIETTVENFLCNYIKFKEFAVQEELKDIGEKIVPDKWKKAPQEVNAFYNPSSNEIVFPAAILRFPFYDIGLPITYNYGGIGMTIGHEILHGFDTQGSKFDSKGRLREWWTKSSRSEYLSKTKCIVNQYASYTINNKSLPSLQTIGEDIADNAGIRMSYLAVNSKLDEQEKLTLPGVDLSPEQLFFVGAGRNWCTLVTNEAVDTQLKEDVHSIWKYRINGPISNMPEFSKLFNCGRNKNMNRPKKCLVW